MAVDQQQFARDVRRGEGMRRTGMPPRTLPLSRTSRLEPGTPPARTARLGRNVQLRAVSAKRARENRQRAAMADRRWPDRRDGGVLCAVWEAIQPDWCDRFASDLHEIVRRSQGGSIIDDENTTPACRTCNGLLADGPDWGYRIGVIRHDALCCQGRAVCAQYEDGSDAA